MKAKTALVASIATAGLASMANAQIWNETANGGGDAGQLLPSAQAVGGPSVTSITGALSNGQDIDMYQINVTNAAAFNATVTAFAGLSTDSQLYLFNAAGLGIAFDDDAGVGLFSSISNTAGPDVGSDANLISASGNGIYYLVITRFDTDALNSGGLDIWHSGAPYSGPFAPDGPGAANATLVSWGLAGVSATATNYTISLSGVSPVPAPGAVALLGLAGLVGSRRRRR